MELYHGSYETIIEINSDGVFGGLFGASSQEAALSHGEILHLIISQNPLTNYELNYEVEGAWDAALEVAGGDEDVASSIMSKECEVLDSCAPEDAAEQSWEFQRLRGVLAQKLGFTSVEMADEHGTTWLCLPGCEVQVMSMEPSLEDQLQAQEAHDADVISSEKKISNDEQLHEPGMQ